MTTKEQKQEQAQSLYDELRSQYPHINVALKDAERFVKTNPRRCYTVHLFADWLLANGAGAEE